MAVCRFFQQGRCKFGERCRDEHPGRNTTGSNSRNPFAPLQNTSARSLENDGRDSNSRIGEKYKLDKDSIRKDLTDETPQYCLSAYGPGRDPPIQLFGGQLREKSFEEMRLRFYELASQGKQAEASDEYQALQNDANQQMRNILTDLDGAIKYICNGENEHPNRIDVCKARGQTSTQPQSQTNETWQPKSLFGESGSRTNFGKPSSTPAVGQSSGLSTVGQPSISALGHNLNTPAFGQPSGLSTFGRPSTSTFGKPSAPVSVFSQATRPAPDRFSAGAFAQPSAPNPAFGQTTAPAFGQTTTPAFGQPATLGGTTTSFGQPSSAFGQPSALTPVFGRPSSQSNAFASHSSGGTSTFGKPSTQVSAFGQPSAPSLFAGSKQSGVFGTPDPVPLGQNAEQSRHSAFLAPSTTSFGQPTTTSTNPPSMQTSAATSSPFGPSAPVATGGLFGRPSTSSQIPFPQTSAQQQSNSATTTAASSATNNAPSAATAVIGKSSIHLPDNNVATKDAQGNLRSWKSKEVRFFDDNWHYRDTSKSVWQRIWFPNGPPTFKTTKELPETAYDETAKEKYLFAMKHERFEDGGIPLMPPRKEWCNWNI